MNVATANSKDDPRNHHDHLLPSLFVLKNYKYNMTVKVIMCSMDAMQAKKRCGQDVENKYQKIPEFVKMLRKKRKHQEEGWHGEAS